MRGTALQFRTMKSTLRVVAIGLAIAGCSRDKGVTPPAPRAPQPAKFEGMAVDDPPPAHPREEALARKARSEARLKKANIKVNATLPIIETQSEAQIRSVADVVGRALALTVVAIKGEGSAQSLVVDTAAKIGAVDFLSPKEHAFFSDNAPAKVARVQFAWRYECLNVMLWAG